MNKKQHKARHEKLHKMLDELTADFIKHTGKRPSITPLLEFMEWSFVQTQTPHDLIDDKEDNNGSNRYL